MGVKTLLSMMPQEQNKNVDQMLTQVQQTATTLREQIQVVPVIAELAGPEVALKRLDEACIPEDDEQLRRDVRLLRAIYTVGADSLGQEDRSALIDRYGWFGKLALSWKLPPTDPLRREALAPAIRTAVTGLAALVGLGLAMLLGIGLLILVIALRLQGRLRELFQPPERGGGAFIEGFAIYLAWFVGVSLVARYFGGARGMLSIWTILVALAPLACLWPLARGVGFADLRGTLGWHCGRGPFREIGSGIVGYIAGLPIMALGIILTVILSRRLGVQPTHPAVDMISSDPWKILGLLSLASVYAPIVEETTFRGCLYGGVRRVCGIVVGALIVSFIFAAIHPQGWAGVPALMGIAIVLTLLREWRGSLIAPITAHAINNGAVIVFLVLAAV